MEERKIVKVTVNLPEEDVNFLKEIAEINGFSTTHALRCAIADMRFTRRELLDGYVIIRARKDPEDKELPREIVFSWKATKE